MSDTDGSREEPSGAPVEEGAPSWTVTFGDMMSLLLTFFILLFSMSELKMEKFRLASQSLRGAMGGGAGAPVPAPTGLMPNQLNLEIQSLGRPPSVPSLQSGPGDGGSGLEDFTEAYLDRIRRRLQDFVDENTLSPGVNVVREEEGVYLRMETVALFASGEHRVQPRGGEILESLSRITRELDVSVVVSGHADNQPIRSGIFDSNWELSAARAAGVAHILVEQGHPPELVRVESYGEFRPVADNTTSEGRARNRRVELFYSREDVRAAALNRAAEEEEARQRAGVNPDAVPH